MGRPIVWAALALAAVACTDSGTGEPVTTAPAPVLGPGELVVLDGSGDVIVMDPDGSNETAVTDDAGVDAVYTQPIWSPDATTLAWGRVSEDGFAVVIQELGSGSPTFVETSNLPFYMSWSPDGKRLGVLHNGIGGIDFRMVDVDGGTSITVDTAAPYYFSWSPDGSEVVTHAGEDRVETITPDGGRLRLEPTSPGYLAPQWTARGVFHVVSDELVLEGPEGERTPVVAVSGVTMFVANSQGTRVALQVAGGSGAIQAALGDVPTAPAGSVVVVDVETGGVSMALESLAVGFFWSPDGESLLIMDPEEGVVVPRVWELSGNSTRYDGYLPPGTMIRDTLPFFPQYAQSVSFWSPDSGAFAYAGDIEGDQGIWVQDLGVAEPTKVSEGIWVAWSSGR